jgi:hypothetical protein
MPMPAEMQPSKQGPRVVIAGGGAAGVEALLALRALAGPGPSIELVSPDRDLVYRPLRVTEPFDLGEVRRFSLEDITGGHGASLRPGALTSVDPAGRRARLRSGEWLAYDFLLVATGARAREALPGARAFNGRAGTNDLAAVLDAVRAGRIHQLAFAVPDAVSWPLPLYELALLTAWRLDRQEAQGVTLSFVTPEQEPLEVFGVEAPARPGRAARAAPRRRQPLHPRSGHADACWLGASVLASLPTVASREPSRHPGQAIEWRGELLIGRPSSAEASSGASSSRATPRGRGIGRRNQDVGRLACGCAPTGPSLTSDAPEPNGR